jgi:hypothetical protein
MLTILGGLAEFERELIKARTADGRKRALDRGVQFGRKPKLTPHQIAEALARRANGEALMEIARSYNVSHSTISRLQGYTNSFSVFLNYWPAPHRLAFSFAPPNSDYFRAVGPYQIIHSASLRGAPQGGALYIRCTMRSRCRSTGVDSYRDRRGEFRLGELQPVLPRAGAGVRFNEHLEHEDGPTVFAHACRMGLEGIVSKRKGSLYRSGRTTDWVKAIDVPAADATDGISRIEIAVAQILLHHVQDELPQWAAVKDGELLLNRQRHRRHKDGLLPFRPQSLFSINWATSGPWCS